MHCIQRRKDAGTCNADNKKGNILSSTYSKETKNPSNDKRISRERIRHEVAFFIMNIIELLNNGANVQLVINALDLKEAFLQWNEETRQPDAERKAESYLSAQETADKLGVDVSTLWRWDKSVYLKKIKLGNKIRYIESEVLKLMEG